jgi:RHS repeat-associated protein
MPNISLMKWDYQDQLRATAKQVVHDAAPETTWYVYDAHGQRVRKVTDRSTTSETPKILKERIYLSAFEIYRKYDDKGSIALERDTLTVADDRNRVALVDYRTRDAGGLLQEQPLTRYQITNHLGSVSLELDEYGQVISYEEYTSYGDPSYYIASTGKRYRYTGKERDKESGLYYNGLRYYNSTIGRWINCDPIYVEGGLNLYSYVYCNPVNLTDPHGTAGWIPEVVTNIFRKAADIILGLGRAIGSAFTSPAAPLPSIPNPSSSTAQEEKKNPASQPQRNKKKKGQGPAAAAASAITPGPSANSSKGSSNTSSKGSTAHSSVSSAVATSSSGSSLASSGGEGSFTVFMNKKQRGEKKVYTDKDARNAQMNFRRDPEGKIFDPADEVSYTSKGPTSQRPTRMYGNSAIQFQDSGSPELWAQSILQERYAELIQRYLNSVGGEFKKQWIGAVYIRYLLSPNIICN